MERVVELRRRLKVAARLPGERDSRIAPTTLDCRKSEAEDLSSFVKSLFNNQDESQRASGASSPRDRCTTPAHQGLTAAPSP